MLVRGLRIEKKCFGCEKILVLLPSRVKKVKFCSHGCRNTHYLTGRKMSPEHIEKLRQVNIGRIPWNKGVECPDYIRKKISKSNMGKVSKFKGLKRLEYSGENHPNWIKDRTKIKLGDRNSHDPLYKQWRKEVISRDNYKCRITDNNCDGRMETHHILSWKDFPELRYKTNNGITLCHAHHPKKRAEEKRLESYFMELVSVSK